MGVGLVPCLSVIQIIPVHVYSLSVCVCMSVSECV